MGIPHAARRTPHAARRTPHAARRTPHAARRTPHAARRTPHAARRTPHAARRTPFSPHHFVGVFLNINLTVNLIRTKLFIVHGTKYFFQIKLTTPPHNLNK